MSEFNARWALHLMAGMLVAILAFLSALVLRNTWVLTAVEAKVGMFEKRLEDLNAADKTLWQALEKHREEVDQRFKEFRKP